MRLPAPSSFRGTLPLNPVQQTRTFLFLLVTLLATGCNQEPATPSVAPSISTPPSVQAAAAQTEAPAIITLSEQQLASLNIQTAMADPTPQRFPLTMPATVYPAPDHVAISSAPISGRITRIYAHEGEYVKKGSVLLEIESLQFASLIAGYLQAQADVTYRKQQVDRINILVDKKISAVAEQELEKAELLRAQAALQATYAQLSSIGVSDASLEKWQNGDLSRPVLAIRAPINGTINEHLIELGQAVDEHEALLNIVNPKQVMIRGFVSPENAHLISAGDQVEVPQSHPTLPALKAKVNTISPALDENSKSVAINVITATQNGWPMPGQNVQLNVLAALPGEALAIPMSAMQYEGNQATVFVKKSEREYEKRFITPGRINEHQVLVVSGLDAGEEVATSQVFSLKALSRFEQYGEE